MILNIKLIAIVLHYLFSVLVTVKFVVTITVKISNSVKELHPD